MRENLVISNFNLTSILNEFIDNATVENVVSSAVVNSIGSNSFVGENYVTWDLLKPTNLTLNDNTVSCQISSHDSIAVKIMKLRSCIFSCHGNKVKGKHNKAVSSWILQATGKTY